MMMWGGMEAHSVKCWIVCEGAGHVLAIRAMEGQVHVSQLV